jgi:hypothetical protein
MDSSNAAPVNMLRSFVSFGEDDEMAQLILEVRAAVWTPVASLSRALTHRPRCFVPTGAVHVEALVHHHHRRDGDVTVEQE